MAGMQDFYEFRDEFSGAAATLPTTASAGCPWVVADTSASGTPVYTTGGSELTVTLASNNEIENVCVHFGNALEFDIGSLQRVEFAAKLNGTPDATTTIVLGLGSNRNDNPDSVTANAWFRLQGSGAVLVETDDNVRDNDDVATGVTLGTSYKKFVIDFTGGTSDVRFYIDGVRVAASTAFDMSGYTSGLQPILQIQKTANANTNGFVVDYIKVNGKRL